MTTIRITPNYETLRDLLGGDDSAMVELRQGIAEEFARKHLKALINTDVMQRAIFNLEHQFAQVNKEIDDRINRRIGERKSGWGGYTFELNADVETQVNNTVSTAIESELRQHIEVIVSERVATVKASLDRLVHAEVQRKINGTIQQMVDTEVQRRLRAALEG